MLAWLRRRHRPARRRSPEAEWLEPRLLYSADLSAGWLPAALTPEEGETRTLTATGELATSAAASTLAQAYATTALVFERNEGQDAAGVDFIARGSGYAIALADGDACIALAGADTPVQLHLVGANAQAQVQGEGQLQARSNYLVGSDPAGWRTGIANFSAVRYDEVWDGVDVRYYGTQRQLEYDFLLDAGADASRIRMRFEGAEVSLDAQGNLVLRTGNGGELRFAAPVSWQEGALGREAVTSAYVLHEDGSVGFSLGNYDRTRALVIDPVLQYASYFGGTSTDVATDVAVDAAGNVYVTGYTTSTSGLLGNVLGGLLGGILGGTGQDAYVAKFSPDLSTLLYVTRIGGGSDDQALAIAVDATGQAVVTGWTESSNFPTEAPAQASDGGTRNAFVFKLNAAGDDIVFGTYYGDGAATNESGNAVALDAAGSVYVTGAVRAAAGGGTDAFVQKYDADGNALAGWKYGGRGHNEWGTDIAVDAAGNIYLTGNTDSDDLVTTANADEDEAQGGTEAFLARFNSTGGLTYGTYISGDQDDFATALAVDANGIAYVVGQTDNSDTSDFATTANALRTTRVGHLTGYLRVYDTNPAGPQSLLYSTFLGGSNTAGGATGDRPTGVALAGNRVVVVSQTDSTDMPLAGETLTVGNSGGAMHVAVLRPQGAGSADLQWGSYYGSNFATGFAVVQEGTQRLVVAGTTSTGGLSTSGTAQPGPAGGTDALVVAVGLNAAPTLAGANPLTGIAEDSTAGTGTLVSALVAGRVSDADASAASGIAITMADNGNGTWQYTLDGSTWLDVGTRTSATALLLAADGVTRVRFVPATNFAGTAGLRFRAWDGTSGSAGATVDTALNGGSTAFSSTEATSNITVAAVNDQPVLATGTLAAVNASDGTTPLGLAGLAYGAGGGTDEAGQSFTYTVTTVPASTVGRIVLADGSTTVTVGASYTLAQLQAMQFVAAPGITSGSTSFGFRVTDSGGTAGGGVDALDQSVSISVTNEAPLLNGVNAMPPMLEDPASNSGMLVSDLIAGQASDAGGRLGIAVTGETSPNGGRWEFSLDGGTTWSQINPSVSDGRARLLAADALTRVRFVPGADWTGTATLTFRAWDQSGGTVAGTRVDIVTVGGSSPYSTTTATAFQDVLPVNDAPVRTAGTVGTVTVPEGYSGTLSLSSLAYGVGGGNDESAQVLSYTITLLPPTAFGTVTLSDGTAVVAGSSYTLADLRGLRFVAASGSTGGSATLSWTVRDNGGTANGGQDSLAESLTIAITNQAPVLSGANPLAAIAEDATGNNGTLVSDIVAGRITDPSSSYGIAVVSASDPNGTWQYSRDGGATWSDFSGVSGSNATLLAADALNRIRFVPAADWSGSAGGLVFHAWDQSGGTAGATTGNTGSTGGNTPYSTATATATIVVTPVDDASVLAPDAQTVAEDTPATGDVLANDTDVDSMLSVASFTVAGDATTYTAGQSAVIAGIGTITLAANGSYVFTPAANWNGSVPVVSYTTNTGASHTLTLTVTAVDDASVLAPDAQTVAEDTPATGDVLANDTDIDSTLSVASFTVAGDATTYTAGQSAVIAGIGTITLVADGSYVFTPAANWNGGVPVVSYTTNTGASSTLTLAVTPVDDASTLAPDAETLAEDAAASGNVLANDTDIDSALAVASFTIAGDATTYTAGQSAVIAGIGSITLAANGDYVFTPAADWNGIVPQVRYTTNTGALGTLTLVVAPMDDPTTASPDNVVSDEDQVATGNVLANDTDVDGPLAVASFTVAGDATVYAAGQSAALAGIGSITISGDGSYVFTPAANWNGSVPAVSYTTTTGATGQLAVIVRPVDDASVLAPDAQTVREDEGASGNVLANDSDIDSALALAGFTVAGDATAYAAGQVATIPGIGSIRMDADGGYVFTPVADWNGSVPVLSYTTTTGASAFLALTVSAVNDAPLMAGAFPGLAPVESAPAASLGFEAVGYGPGGGADEAGQRITVRMDAVPDRETGILLLADGVTAVVAGGTYTLAELQGLRFFAQSGSAGRLVELRWTVSDDGGTDAGGADSTRGGLQFVIAAGAGLPPAPVAPQPEPIAPAPAPETGPPVAAQPPAAAPAAPVQRPGERQGEAASIGETLGAIVRAASPELAALADTSPDRKILVPEATRSSIGTLLDRGSVQLVGFNTMTADFQVRGFAGAGTGGMRMAADDLSTVLRGGSFVGELDRLRDHLREEFDLDKTVSISVAGLSLGVSVLYLLWLVRGGVLVGSYLSALPAWRMLDPLPVLARAGEDEEDDDDALDTRAEAPADPLRGIA